MKHLGSNPELLQKIRRFTITPSTNNSQSASPFPANPAQAILTKDLAYMQAQLAAHLKKHSEDLNLQLSFLQYRHELTQKRSKRTKNSIETVRQFIKQLNDTNAIENSVYNIEMHESQTSILGYQTQIIKLSIQKARKTQNDLIGYEKKKCALHDNYVTLSKELQRMKSNKEDLIESLQEIHRLRKEIMLMYVPIKDQLENIMISKEELLLTIPNIGTYKDGIEGKKKVILRDDDKNGDLRDLVNKLEDEWKGVMERKRKKSNELKKFKEKHESRVVLIGVQQRYLGEKQARIEFVKNELKTIGALLTKELKERDLKIKSSCNKQIVKKIR